MLWGVGTLEEELAYVQALRADPPALANGPGRRRKTFGYALQQFSELLSASSRVEASSSPITLFYALAQAGRGRRSLWNAVVAMRTEDPDSLRPRTRTFRESLAAPSWTVDGGGLSSTDRREWKAQLAAIVLIDALAAKTEFRQQAGNVAAERSSAWDLSLRYARGRKRREVIALLLDTAAATYEEHYRKQPLYELTVRGWGSRDDPPGRASSYAFRPDFARVVVDGAEFVARRGAGHCFERGRSANDGDYCRMDDRTVNARTKIARERSIEHVFYYARRRLAHRLYDYIRLRSGPQSVVSLRRRKRTSAQACCSSRRRLASRSRRPAGPARVRRLLQ